MKQSTTLPVGQVLADWRVEESAEMLVDEVMQRLAAEAGLGWAPLTQPLDPLRQLSINSAVTTLVIWSLTNQPPPTAVNQQRLHNTGDMVTRPLNPL